MKHADPVALRSASKMLIPVVALLAVAAIASNAPGGGLAGGALLSLSLILHMLIYGAEAAQRAAPAWLLRVCFVFGFIACAIGAASPDWRFAALITEVGVALICVSAIALILVALVWRAPALRDGEW
ncbi:MAG: MnhB domain-containing protein [Caulobacterales bacterium]